MKTVPWRPAVLGLALCALASPATAVPEETRDRPVRPERQVLLEGERVPIAARADALFRVLASLEGGDSEGTPDGFLLAAGLDPASPAARSLVDLAIDVAERHPLAIPEETAQRFTVSGDDAGFLAWQRRRNLKRSEAVGAAFGAWLAERREEGYAIGPLADRLLRSPLLRVTIGGDGTAADVVRDLDRRGRRFERGLATRLPDVPKVLRREEDER